MERQYIRKKERIGFNGNGGERGKIIYKTYISFDQFDRRD